VAANTVAREVEKAVVVAANTAAREVEKVVVVTAANREAREVEKVGYEAVVAAYEVVLAANTGAAEVVVAVDMGVAVVAGLRSLSSPPSPLREVSAARVAVAAAGYNPRATACRSRTCRPGLAVSAYNK
jgi:hypothetical protein